MKLISTLLATASVANAIDTINYQKLGQCGIPAKGFNDNGDTDIWNDVLDRKKRQVFSSNSQQDDNQNNNSTSAGLRIVGGTTAKANSWPWQIHLAVCGKWYGVLECNICGGSLIHPQFVVSAAHCVPDGPAGTIILGADNVSEGGTQRVAVEKFIKHPKWGEYGGKMFDHDISVLKLKTAARMSAQVSPICLPSDDSCFATGTQCVVTGWGLLSETGGFPEQLQQVSVRLMKLAECKKFTGYKDLTDNMVCAGYINGQQDACAGDSGGPLVCRHPSGAWVLHGVVSWGYGCARASSPGIYARVSRLKDFVYGTIKTEIDCSKYGCGDGEYPVTSDSALDNSNLSEGNGFEFTDDEGNFDKTSGVDRCLKINNENLFNSGWYDQYKENRENEDMTPQWENGAEEEQVVETCQITEIPELDNPLEISYDSLRGASKGTLKSDKRSEYSDGSSYEQNQKCEWRLKPRQDADEFVRVTIKRRTSINCGGADALRITPMDNGARTYKMCNVRRDVNINSNHGVRIQFQSDDRRDYRKNGFVIDYKFVDRTHMCDSSSIVHLGNFDDFEAEVEEEIRAGKSTAAEKQQAVESIKRKQNGYKNVGGRIVFDLKSENFPGYYSTGSQCRWAIKVPEDWKICYNIRIFRTERSNRCDKNNDVLVSFNAPDCETTTLESATVNFAMCGYQRRAFFRELKANEYTASDFKSAAACDDTEDGVGCISNDQCWVFVSDNDRRRNRGFWMETWAVPASSSCRSYRPSRG